MIVADAMWNRDRGKQMQRFFLLIVFDKVKFFGVQRKQIAYGLNALGCLTRLYNDCD